MSSYYQFNGTNQISPRQVLSLADKVLSEVLSIKPNGKISHLITATSCPDQLAPSMGQMIYQKFSEDLSETHILDLVQGCAGGTSALILGSELAQMHSSDVLVVLADAARNAVSESDPNYHQFGNGCFGCIISYNGNGNSGLKHKASKAFKELTEVVQIKLGHDANFIIKNESVDIAHDPIAHLGLSLDNELAMRLMRKAKSFYKDFVNQAKEKPDVMIFHQVNLQIIRALKSIFQHEIPEIIDVTEIAGNCGTASVGIALDSCKENLSGKKVMICGFGTGGIITAGLWQF